MTSSKSTKRALISSTLAILMCVAMLIGTTFAWFTDTASTAVNKIQAGTLDVQLLMYDGTDYVDISNDSRAVFGTGSIAQNNNASTLWEPGKTQVAYLAIKNNGNLALKYKVALDVDNVSKNLYEVMEYAITPDATNTNPVSPWTTGNSVVEGTQVVANNVSLAKGATHYFALSVHMKEEAGNDYQGGEVDFDLTVLATQDTVESDSFNNQYDVNAKYATTVSNAAQLQAALNAGENVVLGADIDLTNVTWTPAGATADTAYSGTIDGQGHKIIGLSGGNSEGPFGLIAYGTGDVSVKNLTFENVSISSDEEYAAAVMGLYVGREGDNVATYNVTFENITVNGNINASDKAAAILGCNYRSSYMGSNKNIVMTFNNCVNNASISGGKRNGGIAGAVNGQFTADGRNSEIKVVFNNCVNRGTITSNSATYKTGAIVGFASGDGGNYEFNNCVNNGSADGNLLGRFHASIWKWDPTTSSDTSFMYLDFVPQTITIFDAGSIRKVNLTFKWISDHDNRSPRVDTGNYRTGTALGDDEWRITVDGEHYRIAMNTPFNGANDAGCVVDSHNVNPADVENHWTGSEYTLESYTHAGSGDINYVYNKTTSGK